MADKPTFCGQPIDQGELHPGKEYPGEGYAVLSCGGTSVVLGYTLLHHLDFCTERESSMYSQLVAANKALHAITAEASIGRKGFTLIELLVVLAIVALISVLALPTVVPAISHRQVSEGARLLQASIAGARDRAALTGRPAGIRLLPDPASIRYLPDGRIDIHNLTYNRWIPIEVPPNYSEGTTQAIPTDANGATLFP